MAKAARFNQSQVTGCQAEGRQQKGTKIWAALSASSRFAMSVAGHASNTVGRSAVRKTEESEA